jgi:hypothetical protein
MHAGSIAIILGVFIVLGTETTLTGVSAPGSEKDSLSNSELKFELGIRNS